MERKNNLRKTEKRKRWPNEEIKKKERKKERKRRKRKRL